MKPFLIFLTVLSSFNVAAAPSTNPFVSESAVQAFKESFATASDVNWSYANNVYKASFLLNGQYATAFYNGDGTFLGVTRHISSLQLPLTLQASLKKQNKNMWVSELFEAITEQGVQYYVTLEDADNKVVFKADNSTSWSVFQKVRKS